MDIQCPKRFFWVGQVLALCVPLVLAGCQTDLNVLTFGNMQKFVALYREIDTSCSALLAGQTEQCPEDCDEQVLNMVELYHGSPIFFTCDCNDPAQIYPKENCLNVQDRLAICPTLVTLLARLSATTPASTTPTFFEDGRMPCDTARRRCLDNTDCQSNLKATIAVCAGPECNNACQDSLDTLLSQREAQGLWDCTACGQGEGEEEWCDLSKRCKAVQKDDGTSISGSLMPYKPGGTAKATDDEDDSDQSGSARKSAKPENGARPTFAPQCFSSMVLYLVVSVSLCFAVIS